MIASFWKPNCFWLTNFQLLLLKQFWTSSITWATRFWNQVQHWWMHRGWNWLQNLWSSSFNNLGRKIVESGLTLMCTSSLKFISKCWNPNCLGWANFALQNIFAYGILEIEFPQWNHLRTYFESEFTLEVGFFEGIRRGWVRGVESFVYQFDNLSVDFKGISLLDWNRFGICLQLNRPSWFALKLINESRKPK